MNVLRKAALGAGIWLMGCGAALASAPTPAPSPAPQGVQFSEAGASHESLSNGYGNWDSQYLRIVKRNADQQQAYGELQSADRYGMHDNAITIGMYVPLGPMWLANVEGSASDTHLVLPSSSFTAGVQYNSGSHWFEGIAFRNTVYDGGTVNSGVFTLEHYWNAYRMSYALNVSDLAGTGSQAEHAFEIDRYYGQSNGYVGVAYVTGREIDNFGLPVLQVSQVSGWSLNGRHWMNAQWALAYGFGSLRQGTLYTRAGGHLGLDYRF